MKEETKVTENHSSSEEFDVPESTDRDSNATHTSTSRSEFPYFTFLLRKWSRRSRIWYGSTWGDCSGFCPVHGHSTERDRSRRCYGKRRRHPMPRASSDDGGAGTVVGERVCHVCHRRGAKTICAVVGFQLVCIVPLCMGSIVIGISCYAMLCSDYEVPLHVDNI